MLVLLEKDHADILLHIGALLELSERGNPLNPVTKDLQAKISAILLPVNNKKHARH